MSKEYYGVFMILFRCIICSGNTYSFYKSDITCHECPKNAECVGGQEIVVD